MISHHYRKYDFNEQHLYTNQYKYSLNWNVPENNAKIKIEHFRRVNLILKSVLNSINIITAHNTWAYPIIAYSFGKHTYPTTDL